MGRGGKSQLTTALRDRQLDMYCRRDRSVIRKMHSAEYFSVFITHHTLRAIYCIFQCGPFDSGIVYAGVMRAGIEPSPWIQVEIGIGDVRSAAK